MGREIHDYDLVVLGSGPGGYVAALRAAQRGLRTALVERSAPGGVCLNWGCIPTKALLRSAHAFLELAGARRLGLTIEGAGFDYAAVQRRSRQVVERLVKAILLLLERGGVELWQAGGRLDGRDETGVRVALEPAPGGMEIAAGRARRATAGETLRAPRVILAAGGRARELPGLPFDGERILSSREALALTAVPRRCVIIGAGAIGVEFADLFSTFGSQVTLVEMLPGLLPGMEAEAGEELKKALQKRRVRVLTGTRVAGVDDAGGALRCRAEPAGDEGVAPGADEGAEAIEADRVLVAVGVRGNVEDLGLETLGIVPERGFVAADEHQRTSAPGVYAIGDLTGPPLLAHAASAQGIHAADHAAHAAGRLGGPEPESVAREWMPGVVYTRPQVASVGLDEATARARHGAVDVGRFPFVGLGRAVAENETGGFVKVILEPGTRKLLGAHAVSPIAGELIAELTLIGRCGLSADAVLATVHAHPTMAEAVPEAFGAAVGLGLHG
ncbi:MAG: dihydrolipoyl dehydrogenase [Candidatus Eisenbacteria bacterium]|uniref:Dihydrolipoyl dehydrogenase n=1 Tax=Eiseniibacteriota bacterium TaxID=2212470 RepID=A0A938BMV1_UNCEI|nr:dihydrolipoyl dehydrogenase [Candidatus Eisenbacteria bacterium]